MFRPEYKMNTESTESVLYFLWWWWDKMAPLESLEKEYPLIDSNFQSFCASHGFFSGSVSLSLYHFSLFFDFIIFSVAHTLTIPLSSQLKIFFCTISTHYFPLRIIIPLHRPWSRSGLPNSCFFLVYALLILLLG